MNHYNIMTSCDEGAALYIAVELMSIAENLRNDSIDFFLLHSKVSKKTIEILSAFCDEINNITFHEVIVPNPEEYDKIGRFGGGYPGEAYYSVTAHKLLPENIDRILYLDAGDILILGDIAPYYNYDFNDKTIIATLKRFKHNKTNGKITGYNSDDLQDPESLIQIICGLFNSGSYVMNIEKMRKDNMDTSDFIYLSDILKKNVGDVPIMENKTVSYWGDEGILSAAYAGDIRYYAFPEIQNVYYMPYNFCMFRDSRMDYEPIIFHYAGPSRINSKASDKNNNIKPWNVKYPVFIERFQKEENLCGIEEIKPIWREYFYLWGMYAVAADRILSKTGY